MSVRRLPRSFHAAVAASMTALLLTACSQAPAAGPGAASAPPSSPAQATPPAAAKAPKRGGTLNIEFLREPTLWDPMLSEASPPATYAAPLYPHLFVLKTGPEINPNEHHLEPDLVKSWEQTDDRTWVFKLRDGAKWGQHPKLNGRAINAEDVVFSLKRLQSDASALRASFEPVEAVQALDPQTVKVTLKHPFSPFLNYLSDTSAVILPPEVAEEARKRETAELIGGGPWLLESYASGSKVTYKPNPSYYRTPPYVERLVVNILPDQTIRETAFESKQLDILGGIDYRRKQTLEKKHPGLGWSAEGAAHYGLYLNTRVAPWDNPQVRKAVRMGIDQDAYIRVLYPGPAQYESPVRSFLSPWALPQARLKELQKVNVTEAKRLLAEAGYPNGFDGGELFAYPGQGNVKLVEPVVDMLKRNLNITMKIQQLEFTENLNRIQKGSFGIAHFIYSRRYPDPDQFLYPRLHSTGPLNYSKCADPKLDQMLEAQRRTRDEQARIQTVHQVQEYFLNDLNCMIMLPAEEDYSAWWPHVQGYRSHVAFGLYEYLGAWIDKD